MKALNRRDLAPWAGLCSVATFPKKFRKDQEMSEKAVLDA